MRIRCHDKPRTSLCVGRVVVRLSELGYTFSIAAQAESLGFHCCLSKQVEMDGLPFGTTGRVLVL